MYPSSLSENVLSLPLSSSVKRPSKPVPRAPLNNSTAALSLSFTREIPAHLQQLSPYSLAILPFWKLSLKSSYNNCKLYQNETDIVVYGKKAFCMQVLIPNNAYVL